MQPYKNLGGNSNVEAYKISYDSITVKFKSGKCQYYLYTYDSCGEEAVELMKQLAIAGQGLGSMLATKPYHKDATRW